MTSDARAMGRNLSLISLNKVAQLIGGVLWALLIPRWLGPETYGMFALAMSISLLLWWLGDFGGLEVFGRYMPTLQERQPQEAHELFDQFFILRLLVAISLVPLMLVVGPLIAPWLSGWPAALVGLSAGIHIVSWTSYHLLYARKEMGKWSTELSWRLLTQLPLILLVGKYGLTAQMAAYAANELIYLALGAWWTRDWFSRALFRPHLGFLRPFLRMGAGFWVTNIGLILLFRSGTILVQLLTNNPVQVAYYDLALVVFFLVYTIIDQLVRAFLPTISQYQEGGQKERVGYWLQMVTQWGAAQAVIAVIAVQYTARWIMPLILGSAFAESAVVLQIMLLSLPALVLVGVGTVASAVRESARAKLIAIGAGIVVFYGSSVFLTTRLDAVGAAWSLTLGLAVYALVLFALVRHDLRLRWIALLGILALGVPFLAARSLVADSLLLAIGATIVAAVLYLGIALALRLISPAPLRLLPRLIARSR